MEGAIDGTAGAVAMQLLPSPAEDMPSHNDTEHCHCCALKCCCREPDLWGSGYCSCGLPKVYCSGVHRCMQVLEEEGIGPEIEAWQAYTRSESRRRNRTRDPSPPAPWARKEDSTGSGEDVSSQEDDYHCSIGLSEAGSSSTHSAYPAYTEFEQDLRSVRDWWYHAVTSAWRFPGDWETGGQHRHEENTRSDSEEETSV